MIIIASVILGVFMGIRTAKKRKGTRLDMLQHAFGFAVAFGLLGLLATILLERFVF